jgi:simple sugar transport system permease protein
MLSWVSNFIGSVLQPVIAVGLALGVGAILIKASDADITDAYGQLWDGAAGDSNSLAGSLRIATTILFMSLAFTFAFRAGLFNAGTQGQFVIGAFAAAWVGFTFTSLPGPVLVAMAFLAGLLGGGAWAFVPALLRERWNVNEIVTSLMLSFIALLLVQYLVQYHFSAVGGQVVSTKNIAESAQLTELVANTHLTWALFLALALVGGYGFFLRHTVIGYELSVAGSNPAFAVYGGIPFAKVTYVSMLGSGMIAGLGGAQEILGVHYRFLSEFSLEVGFTGIIASFLGRHRPLGIIIASLFLGGLQNGALNMELFTNVHRSAVGVIAALMVLLATATITWTSAIRPRRRKGHTPTTPHDRSQEFPRQTASEEPSGR